MVKEKIDINIVKTEAETEVLTKKEQITKGVRNKMRKVIRTKNTLYHLNQENNTATRKISINFRNSTVFQNNNKTQTNKSHW